MQNRVNDDILLGCPPLSFAMVGRNKLYLSGELGQKLSLKVPRNFGAGGRKCVKGTIY